MNLTRQKTAAAWFSLRSLRKSNDKLKQKSYDKS